MTGDNVRAAELSGHPGEDPGHAGVRAQWAARRRRGAARTLADRIAVLNELALRGELPNDRDYGRMSQAIIRLLRAGSGPAAAGAGKEKVA